MHVFSGEIDYLTPPAEVWERPSEFYCPVIGSFVTGGSHLLCAMLERTVRDMGGQIAAIDTDSAMLISTKDGGLVPCTGGPHEVANQEIGSRNAAIRALSFAQMDSIRERFEPLNPWRKTLKTPFLKLENENFDANGNRHQPHFYGCSPELYCLFNLDGDQLISCWFANLPATALGFCRHRTQSRIGNEGRDGKWNENLSPWIYETWHFILSRELGLLHRRPSWLKQPAVMVVPITTPQVLARLGIFKDEIRHSP